MKKAISVLLAALMIIAAVPLFAFAEDESTSGPYCTLNCENDTITIEMLSTGIYNLEYCSGEYENISFGYSYDKNILSVDELNEDGKITLLIEPKIKSDTYLRIDMLSESGSIIAQENLTVKVKSYPFGDIIKSMFSTALYYNILNFVYIIPDLIKIPFRYMASAIENIKDNFVWR